MCCCGCWETATARKQSPRALALGTVYDPETGQRVALTDEQIEGARWKALWEAFEMGVFNDDDVGA